MEVCPSTSTKVSSNRAIVHAMLLKTTWPYAVNSAADPSLKIGLSGLFKILISNPSDSIWISMVLMSISFGFCTNTLIRSSLSRRT